MPPFVRSLAGLALAVSCGALPARADAPLGETLARLDREIAATPNDASLWTRRAEALRLASRTEESLDAIDRARELGLAAPVADRERGATLFVAGRVADAEAALRRARDAAPNDAAVLVAHARALSGLGRFRDAADAYDRVVTLVPRANPDVQLARIHAHAASGSLDAALAAVADATARLGRVPALEQAGLDLELRAGRIDAALARLDRMAQESPRDARLRLQRAQVLERGGRSDEASDDYRATLASLDALPATRRATAAAHALASDARAGLARTARPRERGAP